MERRAERERSHHRLNAGALRRGSRAIRDRNSRTDTSSRWCSEERSRSMVRRSFRRGHTTHRCKDRRSRTQESRCRPGSTAATVRRTRPLLPFRTPSHRCSSAPSRSPSCRRGSTANRAHRTRRSGPKRTPNPHGIASVRRQRSTANRARRTSSRRAAEAHRAATGHRAAKEHPAATAHRPRARRPPAADRARRTRGRLAPSRPRAVRYPRAAARRAEAHNQRPTRPRARECSPNDPSNDPREHTRQRRAVPTTRAIASESGRIQPAHRRGRVRRTVPSRARSRAVPSRTTRK